MSMHYTYTYRVESIKYIEVLCENFMNGGMNFLL